MIVASVTTKGRWVGRAMEVMCVIIGDLMVHLPPQELVSRFTFHNFDNLRNHITTKTDPRMAKAESRAQILFDLLFSAAAGDLSALRRWEEKESCRYQYAIMENLTFITISNAWDCQTDFPHRLTMIDY